MGRFGERLRGVLAYAALSSSLLLTACAQNHELVKVEPSDSIAVKDYKIAPGDTLNVMVWRNPDVSMSVAVRPDGKITTPLVEDMPASGKTASTLARDIEKVLAKFIKEPVVTVIVTQPVGRYEEQVRVVGQVRQPQALPYREGMSLMDVMIAVGGISEFAAGNRASIVRTVEGRQQRMPVRLADLIRDGDITANVRMHPGDVLIIPESFF